MSSTKRPLLSMLSIAFWFVQSVFLSATFTLICNTISCWQHTYFRATVLLYLKCLTQTIPDDVWALYNLCYFKLELGLGYFKSRALILSFKFARILKRISFVKLSWWYIHLPMLIFTKYHEMYFKQNIWAIFTSGKWQNISSMSSNHLEMKPPWLFC